MRKEKQKMLFKERKDASFIPNHLEMFLKIKATQVRFRADKQRAKQPGQKSVMRSSIPQRKKKKVGISLNKYKRQ